VDGNLIETTRRVRMLGVLMNRRETRIDAVDLDTQDRRHFRLDRIERAEVLPGALPGPENDNQKT
jgi:predicted DNA-binding transcriptional regulator YafY